MFNAAPLGRSPADKKEGITLYQDLSKNPYAQPFTFEGSRSHGVLVIHGFTATPGTVLPLGQAVAQDGHYVRGILLPGHGTTIEDMQRTNWKDWYDAAFNAYDEMARICKKVSVVGLSMGGALTCLLAEHRPVHKAVPIAPALKILQHGSRLAIYFWSLVPILPGRDKNYQDYLFDYDVCYHDTPVKNIEDLNHLALLAKRDLKKITCPLLVVKAGQDQSVHPDAPKWIILQSSSVEKKLLVLPNSPHVCTLGAERQLLFRKVAAFLRD